MPVLLTSELSLEKVNTIIDEKVELAFNPKANIPQEVKDAVNGQSKRVSADFINFIQYHLQNVNSIDTDSKVERNDDYAANIVSKFHTIVNNLETVLNENIDNNAIMQGIKLVWIGLFTQLSKDADELQDEFFKDNVLIPGEVDLYRMFNKFNKPKN